MSKLRAVLAGCGGISTAWLESIKNRQDVELVGMVDIVLEAAERKAAGTGFTAVEIGTDLEAVLRKTSPDVVLDCTLPETHASVATTAMRMGCHVFGEKPLADTMANAREIVATSMKTGKTHAVMQNRRYLPNMMALRAFLDSGAIGAVTTVHCDFFMGAHFGGFRDRMEHVLLLDMAIHTFDQARFLTGKDAVSALAHEWNPPGSWYDHDASAVAVFEMTGKVVFCYRGSWCAEGPATPWEASWRIIGEKGSVLWDGAHEFRCWAVAGESGFFRETREIHVPYDRENPAIKGHAGCIDDMIACLKAGRTPQTVCTDNIRSLAMVHVAIESASKGQRVACAV
jgi:predicted dehydrogenase